MRVYRQTTNIKATTLPRNKKQKQIISFIGEWLISQQQWGINLNAATIHTSILCHKTNIEEDHSLNNVPYIQSEHYQSNDTFNSEQSIAHQETFKQIAHSSIIDSSSEYWLALQPICKSEQQEPTKADLQFIKHPNSKSSHHSSQSLKTFPIGSTCINDTASTKPSFLPQLYTDEQELQHLKSTAHFRQAQTEEESQKENRPQQNRLSVPSKKEMLLGKIAKERSRKEMAEALLKERPKVRGLIKKLG